MVCKSRGFYFIGTSFMIVTPQPVVTSTSSADVSSPSSSSSPSPGGSNFQSASDSAGSREESFNNSAPISVHSDEEFQSLFTGTDVFQTDNESRFETLL
jgi:hypothetical protein